MNAYLAQEVLKALREELSNKNKASNGIEFCINIENQIDAIDEAIIALGKVDAIEERRGNCDKFGGW